MLQTRWTPVNATWQKQSAVCAARMFTDDLIMRRLCVHSPEQAAHFVVFAHLEHGSKCEQDQANAYKTRQAPHCQQSSCSAQVVELA